MFEAHAAAIDQYINDLDLPDQPHNLYDPVSYHLSMGGKRIRPLLCLLAYELFEDHFMQALPQAVAIELFHNFTLIHDDIMDEAPVRRGAPTLYHRNGLNTGILAGDAMLIRSYQLLATDIAAPLLADCIDVFNEAAIAICEGQQYDMDFESQTDTTFLAYLQMIEAKTAVLLGASLAIGGIRAGAGAQTRDSLWDLGVAIGMAFQIQDDLLDVFGKSEKTGKRRGGDIIQGKKTILLLKALDLAGPRQQADLKGLLGATDIAAEEKIRAVTQIYQALEVQTHCQSMKRAFMDQAFSSLDAIEAVEERKHKLKTLFSSMVDREY